MPAAEKNGTRRAQPRHFARNSDRGAARPISGSCRLATRICVCAKEFPLPEPRYIYADDASSALANRHRHGLYSHAARRLQAPVGRCFYGVHCSGGFLWAGVSVVREDPPKALRQPLRLCPGAIPGLPTSSTDESRRLPQGDVLWRITGAARRVMIVRRIGLRRQ